MKRNKKFKEDKNGKKSEKITTKDFGILMFILALTIALTIPAYTGFLSLLSVFATSLYTISVWQKNVNIYKYIGILVSTLWILYDIYIKSIAGVTLESALLLSVIISIILSAIKTKEKNKKLENRR